MPVNPTYPGVYVQEVPSGVRTIVGVSTSVTLFVGRAKAGPMFQPVRLFNFTDFKRIYTDDVTYGDLARHVKLFFLNGGTDCWVVRIAKNALASAVTLKGEDKAPVLRLEAKSPGLLGENIRAAVSYGSAQPESLFNLELFRWELDARGQKQQVDREVWLNLSMDPTSASYAPTVLTQRSKLVNATSAAAGAGTQGSSLSGKPVAYSDTGNDAAKVAAFTAAWKAELTAAKKSFRVVVGRGPAAKVSMDGIVWTPVEAAANVSAAATELGKIFKAKIDAALALVQPGKTVKAELVDGPGLPGSTKTHLLKISGVAPATEDVRIESGESNDLAVPLMLGTANGGIEVGPYAAHRPAPTGITLKVTDLANLVTLASVDPPDGLKSITLDEVKPDGSVAAKTYTGLWALPDTERLFQQAAGSDGLRSNLGLVRDGINTHNTANPATFRWRAELWGTRLAIIPTGGDDNHAAAAFQTGTTDLAALANINVRYYALGATGTGSFQSHVAGDIGSDGDPPTSSDYDEAYRIVDREVDLFNLMVLPPDAGLTEDQKAALWGPASVFCQKRRAFLLVDPKDSWLTFDQANAGVGSLRTGLVKDHAALFFPRLVVAEDTKDAVVTPSGAMAGLFARIDSARGVWKAPAGTEADLRGVVGVDRRLSDLENGAINPNAINAVRLFPEGVVSWGARTMDGADAFASEYKYIPIRRLALFIEESLYRGLKWVVFEPNDVALWAQIRLNAGAFMHNLFRQGAFQGTKPSEAYFVKCDAETTTETDRNLGIVNIWIGFAPLKPAEFVILYLQQIAGQIPT